MNSPLIPVILSGGAGSRLWPLSRELYPKQLIALVDEYTLLQTTARRLVSLENSRPPIVVCNEGHRFMVGEQLRAVGVAPAAILLEPAARNTAPAIAAAALEALARCDDGDEPLLLVLPSDHVIRDDVRFARAVRAAMEEASAGRLVTFGVVPTRAETGYGYIEAGLPTGVSGEGRLVKSFVEKPNAEDALACIEAGDCYWNSGMFVFGASRYLRELASHAPSICEAVGSAHENMVSDLGFLRLNPESFTESPSTSVDYAVMEHTSDAAVVPLDAGWSDVGSWAGLAGLAERDAAGNTAQGDVILQEVRDTYVHGQDRLVAVVGAEDLVIVDTADAVLVAGRSAAHDVKKVVERLKDTGRDEYRNGRKVYRPWGSYDSVYERGGFLVKHITVNPGQRLSLQMHRHRAEHWIVVRGTARVTRGNEIFMLSENESTYIPRGVKHRLENPDAAPLELVEVQTGSYLGEDDIIRFEDAYGRGDGPSTRSEPGSPGDSG